MRFLKTLFWVMIGIAAAIFSYNNWQPVTVNLWAGLALYTKLPMLLLAAFLLGSLPTLVLHRATRWQLRRKLSHAEKSLNEIRGVVSPAPETGTLPPGGAPIAAPPGVA